MQSGTEALVIGSLILLLALVFLMVWLGRRYFRVAPSRGEQQIVAELNELRNELQQTREIVERLAASHRSGKADDEK